MFIPGQTLEVHTLLELLLHNARWRIYIDREQKSIHLIIINTKKGRNAHCKHKGSCPPPANTLTTPMIIRRTKQEESLHDLSRFASPLHDILPPMIWGLCEEAHVHITTYISPVSSRYIKQK